MTPIQVKSLSHASKRPRYKRLRNPVLNADAFYLLPDKLLDACPKALPPGNQAEDAITLPSQEGADQTASGVVEVVSVPGVGAFSRSQIEDLIKIRAIKKQQRLRWDVHYSQTAHRACSASRQTDCRVRTFSLCIGHVS